MMKYKNDMIKDQCDKCRKQDMNSCGQQKAYDGRSCEMYSRHIDLEKHEKISSEASRGERQKQKLFLSPFSFSGRIRRLEYWLSCIIIYASAFMIVLISEALEELGNKNFSIVISGVYMIACYWFCFAQNAKRCHDRGNSGWYQIIPFYGLFLLFGDGDEYENDYGTDPKGRNIYDA